ncbi:MAG TPA: DinB family protein [Gemmatimonadales bacterium]
MSEKERFLQTLETEHRTTLKVLKAYPAARADFSPHAKCKSAKDLAWNFIFEMKGADMAIDGEMDFRKIPKPPPTYPEVVTGYEQAHREFVAHIKRTPDAELNKTVKFFTAPKQMSDLRRMDVLWFLLHDSIHHRGQFSIYLRMVDARVPSIYGPTADEPWS